MAGIGLMGAATLFPGALTDSLRHRVMTDRALGYAEACWVNEVLPADAVVLAWNRSVALAPRPFLSRDILIFSDLTNPVERDKIKKLIESCRVNTVVTHLPFESERLEVKSLGLSPANRLAGPREFFTAARNPWNRGTVRLSIYRLDEPSPPPRR